MNQVAPCVLADRHLPQPFGVLRVESPLARLWRNRLVPLKTVQPIATLDDLGHQPAKRAHVADLADCTPEDFAAIAALLPELAAASAVMFTTVRELWIDESHFEAVV
jgi:hypothetical protein